MRVIEGFDYRTQQPVKLTSAQWRDQIRKAIADDGFRRCEAGETFIHNAEGRIVAEVYGRVAAPGDSDEQA
jgi:hypothetical protein